MEKGKAWKLWLCRNRKKCLSGYLILTFLYLAVSIAIPHDKLITRGLEGVGKPSLAQKTQEITDDTVLTFCYDTGEEELQDISFYFTAGERTFTQGTLILEVQDRDTGETLGTQRHLLEDLKVEAFWGVSLDEPVANRSIQVEIRGENVQEGPYIWLNTEVDTPGVSLENGQTLEHNLIYNAIYLTQVHNIKQNVLRFAMLVLLGLMLYAVWGDAKEPHGEENVLLGEQASGKEETLSQEGQDSFQEGQAVSGKKRQGLWALYEKYRLLLGLGALFLLVALVFYHVYDVQIRKAMNTTHRVAVMRDNQEMLPITRESAHLEQHYVTEEDTLVGLGVRMDLSEDFVPAGTVTASVTDETTGTLLCSTEVPAGQLLDGQYLGLIFTDSQRGIQGHEYVVELTFSPELYDSGLSVFVTPKGYYEENTLLVGGEESDRRLSMNAHQYFNLFLKKYFFAMFVFFELMAGVLYWALFIKRWRIERVFLLTILCLGVVYNFLLVPYMTPDEKYHIDMSYRHSNRLLGIASAGENKCYKRADDAELTFTSEPTLTNYKAVYDGLFTMVNDNRLVETAATSDTQAPIVVYLPAVLGMTLARVLHLGTVPMYLLARWCSLLCFALLTYWGMRKLPFGKITLFLLAVLPMNLQQCTSFSYDAVISGVIILYTCYCLSLAYGEEQVKPGDMLVLAVLAVVLIYGKSGVYLPVCFLALLIPAKRFRNRRVQLFCVAGLFGLPVLSFLNRNTATVSQIVTTTEATSTVGSSMTAGYTVGYFLQDPMAFVSMMLSTLTDKLGFYLQSLVGQKMGWVEIEISEAIPIFFLILLALSLCKTREEPLYVKTWQKWWVTLVCGASFGIILVGMLLTWTPMGNVSIEGVQGRYLLPLLPAFALVGRNRLLMYERNPERGLAYAAFVGQLFAVMYLIKAVLVIR